MPTATGHRKLLEQLEADGITTMFGNPGSSEEGLLDGHRQVGRERAWQELGWSGKCAR